MRPYWKNTVWDFSKIKKRWNSSKIVVQKYFSTQKMFMTIPKYHGGTMSHCTILDLCHTVRQFQIYFLSFAKVKTRCFLLFGTEKYSTMPIQLESCPPTLSTRQSSSRSQKGGSLPLLTMMIWSLMLNKYCNVIRKWCDNITSQMASLLLQKM